MPRPSQFEHGDTCIPLNGIIGKPGKGYGMGEGRKFPRFPGEGTDGAGRVGMGTGGTGIGVPGIFGGTLGILPPCMGMKLERNNLGLPKCGGPDALTVVRGVHVPESETT
jgi:hypothetical protein